jgi:Flp pilus assembly protein TadD
LEESLSRPKSKEELQRDLGLFLACLKRDPTSEATRGEAMRLAYSLEQAGQPDQAAKILRAGIAADPAARPLRMELIKLFERAGRVDRAIEIILADTDADPRARVDIARYLISKGLFDDAERVMSRGAGVDWSDFHMAQTWGRIQRWRHNFDDAVEAYERALALRPDELELYLWLAEAHLHRGKLDETFPARSPPPATCPDC